MSTTVFSVSCSGRSPREAINQLHLAEVVAAEEVQETMEKHMLLGTAEGSMTQFYGDEEDNIDGVEDSDANSDDDCDDDSVDSEPRISYRGGDRPSPQPSIRSRISQIHKGLPPTLHLRRHGLLVNSPRAATALSPRTANHPPPLPPPPQPLAPTNTATITTTNPLPGPVPATA